jgi:hypothetical protein
MIVDEKYLHGRRVEQSRAESILQYWDFRIGERDLRRIPLPEALADTVPAVPLLRRPEMFANRKGLSRRRASIITAIPVLALCTAAAVAYGGSPYHSGPPSQGSAEVVATTTLEDAFWRCDYLATRYGVHAAPVAYCSEVTARLQEQKFRGDFLQLLGWWRQNKPVEHGKLDSIHVAGAFSR